MDSHRSFSSSLTNSSIVAESETPRSEFSSSLSTRFGVHQKGTMFGNSDGFIGILDVFIHQARDIHNICIYNKQDVYAKLCITSDPEVTVSTQIINGGGKNPVFNENLQLNVRTIESSLKCEVWMLSRVKNYLEDQLLGFALVPLSDVVVGNGKVMQEFSLSSTDLFHSPAGFVQLSLSYNGSAPDVLAIATPPSASVRQDTTIIESESGNGSVPSEYTEIEFPDLKMVNENQLMVSEYIGIQRANLEYQDSEGVVASENDDQMSSEIGVPVVESFSTGSFDSVEALKSDTPPSSVSTNGSPSAGIPTSSQSVCGPEASKSLNHDNVSAREEKSGDAAEGEADSSTGMPNDAFAQSILNIKVEQEQSVVQQDIVDMYMKSMQQFTESLAKMKLPMDIENGSANSDNGKLSSDQKLQPSKEKGSRVFYGSRAFF